MGDLIDRQAALDALRNAENHAFNAYYKGLVRAHKIIAELPSAQPELESADAVQVVHGRWIDEDPAFAEYFANCSVCGYEIDVHNERGYFNFCPHCGAKMDAQGER